MNQGEFENVMGYARSVFISECKHEGKLNTATQKEIADMFSFFKKAEDAASGLGATMGARVMLRLVTGLLIRTLEARNNIKQGVIQ